MIDGWSKRRAAVAAEQEAQVAAVQAEALADAQADQAEKTDAELLAEFDLPDPDDLTVDDDFKAFMGSAIPERIKQRALRKLWRLNPVLANVDGLVEYGEDYTDAATVVENLQTAYQVGKGMLKHVEELARQAEELAAGPVEMAEDASEELEAEDMDADRPEPDVTPEPFEVAEVDGPKVDGPKQELEIELSEPTRIRRMRFEFEAGAAT